MNPPAEFGSCLTPVVKITETRDGFQLDVQEPINVRAVLLRNADGAWWLHTLDAIDGVFLADHYVIAETADWPVEPQERACCEEATAQRWAIEALRQALAVPLIERVA